MKKKDIAALVFIIVAVIAMCVFFVFQNSSESLKYGENGGKIEETEQITETSGDAPQTDGNMQRTEA